VDFGAMDLKDGWLASSLLILMKSFLQNKKKMRMSVCVNSFVVNI